ncbi:MAG: alpha-hydroxy-acid oxidizing protein, partial [Chloroflexota bacterium]|nr:alpha-hydroxy-acid oxidizing protein [Chloroflexota bacterium]
YGIEECQRAVDMIKADALILHLNPLQEALQPEGNTSFSGLLEKIESICRALVVPVVVKEIGFGISEQVANQLANVGVAAIDVAGVGGTSWSEVERHRVKNETGNNIASSFSAWGIPTAQSLLMAKKGAPDLPLIASGGIRSGLDVAKAIALGADIAGIATPLLKAAHTSAGKVIDYLNELIEGLRISMFCCGAATIEELKATPLLSHEDGA